jgi:hypothetical protein
MFASVLVEIDQLGGFGDSPEGCFLDPRWRTRKGDDGAVVVVVGVAVQDEDVCYPGNRRLDGLDDLRSASFGKIRNAFDDGSYHNYLLVKKFSCIDEAILDD